MPGGGAGWIPRREFRRCSAARIVSLEALADQLIGLRRELGRTRLAEPQARVLLHLRRGVRARPEPEQQKILGVWAGR